MRSRKHKVRRHVWYFKIAYPATEGGNFETENFGYKPVEDTYCGLTNLYQVPGEVHCSETCQRFEEGNKRFLQSGVISELHDRPLIPLASTPSNTTPDPAVRVGGTRPSEVDPSLATVMIQVRLPQILPADGWIQVIHNGSPLELTIPPGSEPGEIVLFEAPSPNPTAPRLSQPETCMIQVRLPKILPVDGKIQVTHKGGLLKLTIPPGSQAGEIVLFEASLPDTYTAKPVETKRTGSFAQEMVEYLRKPSISSLPSSLSSLFSSVTPFSDKSEPLANMGAESMEFDHII